MDLKFEELIEGFLENRVGVCNNFLSPDLAKSLQQNLLELEYEAQLVQAGTGNGTGKTYDLSIRGDKIQWLDRANNNAAQNAFLDVVENFIAYLNRTCYAGINGYEFHYALYEPGMHYQRHRDQFATDNGRKYSLVCYLNDDWLESDGGALIAYNGEKIEQVLPNICKAVFFQSDELEHAVAVSTRPRLSIAGWLKRV